MKRSICSTAQEKVAPHWETQPYRHYLFIHSSLLPIWQSINYLPELQQWLTTPNLLPMEYMIHLDCFLHNNIITRFPECVPPTPVSQPALLSGNSFAIIHTCWAGGDKATKRSRWLILVRFERKSICRHQMNTGGVPLTVRLYNPTYRFDYRTDWIRQTYSYLPQPLIHCSPGTTTTTTTTSSRRLSPRI